MNKINIKDIFIIIGAIIALYIVWKVLKLLLVGLTLIFQLALPAAVIILGGYFIFNYIKKRGIRP